MTTRKYSSISQETSLTAALSSGATTMIVGSSTALLSGITLDNTSPLQTFTVVIDPDTALEEIVDIVYPSSTGSNTLTIQRPVDSSAAISHSAGAKIRHMAIGRDFREANTHIENTTTAHGLTIANVVSTTDTATVSNGMIANLAITTGKLADLNVTSGKLADGAVTSGKIANGTIATEDLSDNSVTSAKIADGTIVNVDINSAAEIDKTKIAGTAVTVADTGTITSTMILNDTIVNADINSAAAIAYSKLNLAGSIVSSDIVDGTIVNADVNTSAQIAYGKLNLTNAIINADINTTAAIDKTKISGTALTVADVGTVTSSHIANGTIVDEDISATAGIVLSKLATDPLARANHTGTQTASTISNLDATIKSYKVTDLTAPTTSVSVNSQTITNVATPVNGTDAANKAYADTKIASTLIGANSGVAPLDVNGKVPLDHIPATAIAEVFVVASEAAMLAISGVGVGDIAIRSDLNKSFILRATPGTTLSNWNELLTPTDIVLSVDGQIGVVNLSTTYATIAQDAAKLPLAGGTMSGAIAMGSNKITGLGTPTTTGDAATKDYADTKLPLAGGTMSGIIAMGNNKITGLADAVALTDAVNLNTINNLVLAPSNLTGPITSIGAATSLAAQTGTGTTFVVQNSPTLVTPELGVATATSINGTPIPTSKTLVATDSTTYVVPTQTGNSGKYLTTDGTTSSWGTVAGYLAPTIGSTSIASGETVTTIAGLTLTAPVVNLATNAQAGPYTLVLSDASDLIEMSGGGTLTVPTNASVAFPIGTQITILQTGASQVTIGGAGVIINGTPGLKLRTTWSAGTLIKRATDTWVLIGDLSA